MKTSFDSVAALVRELSVEEQRALVDSDNRPAIKQFLLGLLPLLTPVGTITFRSAAGLVGDFFKVNTEENAPVNIHFIGDNFNAWFPPPSRSVSRTVPGGGPYRKPGVVQKDATEVDLCYHTLNRRSVVGPIIDQLGGEAKVEVTRGEVEALMAKQGNGESGDLITNGFANIFCVRDEVNGTLRAVSVYWLNGGWHVNAASLTLPRGWYAGSRVFSR